MGDRIIDHNRNGTEGVDNPPEVLGPSGIPLDKLPAEKLIEILTDQICDSVTESLEAVEGAIERRIILRVLHKAGGNQTKAAKLLGIKRTTLNYKLKKLNIRVPRAPGGRLSSPY